MDVVNNTINHLMHAEKKQLLLYAIALQAVFVFPLTICCFVVAGTANAGFAFGLMVALINIVFVAGAYHVTTKSKTTFSVGFLLGVSCMVTALNFMNSIFWGQLSGCDGTVGPVAQYSCTNPAAYGALCTFSVFLFLTQLFFTVGLGLWKGEIIEDADQMYEGLSQGSQHMSTQPSTSVDL